MVHHTCFSVAEDRRAIICETAVAAASGEQEREQKVDHMDVEAICRAGVVFERKGPCFLPSGGDGSGGEGGVFRGQRCRRVRKISLGVGVGIELRLSYILEQLCAVHRAHSSCGREGGGGGGEG